MDYNNTYAVLMEGTSIMFVVPMLRGAVEEGQPVTTLWRGAIVIGPSTSDAHLNDVAYYANLEEFKQVHGQWGSMYEAVRRFFFEMPEGLWVFNSAKGLKEALVDAYTNTKYPHREAVRLAYNATYAAAQTTQ